MAAEVTKEERNLGTVRVIKWAWTSHTDGKVALATENAKTNKVYDGEILRLVTVPDGSAVPTADYDVYIYDNDGIDVLNASGEDRSASATEQIAKANLGIAGYSNLNLYVENAGSGKKGTVYLYIR